MHYTLVHGDPPKTSGALIPFLWLFCLGSIPLLIPDLPHCCPINLLVVVVIVQIQVWVLWSWPVVCSGSGSDGAGWGAGVGAGAGTGGGAGAYVGGLSSCLIIQVVGMVMVLIDASGGCGHRWCGHRHSHHQGGDGHRCRYGCCGCGCGASCMCRWCLVPWWLSSIVVVVADIYSFNFDAATLM